MVKLKSTTFGNRGKKYEPTIFLISFRLVSKNLKRVEKRSKYSIFSGGFKARTGYKKKENRLKF